MLFSKEDKDRIYGGLDKLFAELEILKQGSSTQLNRSYPALYSSFKEFLIPEDQEIVATADSIREAAIEIDSVRETVQSFKAEIDDQKERAAASIANIHSMENQANEKWSLIEKNSKESEDAAKSAKSTEEDLAEILEQLEELKGKAVEAEQSLQSLDTTVKQIEDAKNRITADSKTSREQLSNVRKLYIETIGENYTDEDGEAQRTEGLVDKLEEAYSEVESKYNSLQKSLDDLKDTKQNEYNEIKTTWTSRFIEINSKIESLLPGAVTAGLSEAYEKKTKDEKEEILSSNITFNRAIIGLSVISAFPVSLYLYLFFYTNRTFEQITDQTPKVFLVMLPLYLPCLWIAFSSSKKANLSKRLAEEYAHKASLSKTFEGISRQVSNTDDSELAKELRSRLLYNLIQVSAENPGKLITDYNKSDHPLYQVLDKSKELTEMLEKVSLLPGVDKILTVVHERRRRDIAKVSDGIESNEEIERDLADDAAKTSTEKKV